MNQEKAKLKKCKNCKVEIAPKLRRCPYCGILNPTVTLKDIWIGIAIVIGFMSVYMLIASFFKA